MEELELVGGYGLNKFRGKIVFFTRTKKSARFKKKEKKIRTETEQGNQSLMPKSKHNIDVHQGFKLLLCYGAYITPTFFLRPNNFI